MVKEFLVIVVALVTALTLRDMAGHLVDAFLSRKAPTTAEPKQSFSLLDLVRSKPQPQAKKMPTEALPRSIGSWRKQKAELERDHNSKQKERDQRYAGL